MVSTLLMAAAMTTVFGEKVTADNAWREYPRPQMVRNEWTCLNGMWDYQILTNRNAGTVEVDKGRILVPFCFESDLSGVRRLVQPAETMVYSRSFDYSPKSGERLLIHFEAVDWRAHVFVNGEEAGLPHEGGNLPFSYDITDFVKEGANFALPVPSYTAGVNTTNFNSVADVADITDGLADLVIAYKAQITAQTLN